MSILFISLLFIVYICAPWALSSIFTDLAELNKDKLPQCIFNFENVSSEDCLNIDTRWNYAWQRAKNLSAEADEDVISYTKVVQAYLDKDKIELNATDRVS